MKVYHKVLAAAALVICMALGMTGCGSEPVDGSQVVATVGEKEMPLGEANFLLRFQQVQTESFYESMLGEGIYVKDVSGTGSTFGEDFKSNIMKEMQEYYVIEEKAADYGAALTEEETAEITEAAKAFVEANKADTLEQMTADLATVERVLSLMKLRSKVEAAVKAEADVKETAEEAEKETARTEYFNEVLAGWTAEYPFTVVDSVWEQVVFDRSYEVKAE